MKRRLALFEPWGLGDLAISLHIAKNASKHDFEVTVLCEPKYLEWVQSLEFVNTAHGVSVPWSQKSGKYQIAGYPWKSWLATGEKLRASHHEFVIETRRDPRATGLIRAIFRLPVKQPQNRKIAVGYSRLHLPFLGIENAAKKTDPLHELSPSIVCFFGAEWANRRVPHWKIAELLNALQKFDSKITVIVPPEESSTDFYRSLCKNGVTKIEGSIVQIAKHVKEHTHCISTDSGWIHVAHLYGLKTLGLFGFQNDGEWMPPGAASLRSEHCLPSTSRYRMDCDELRPLGTLRVEDFSRSLETFLGNLRD